MFTRTDEPLAVAERDLQGQLAIQEIAPGQVDDLDVLAADQVRPGRLLGRGGPGVLVEDLESTRTVRPGRLLVEDFLAQELSGVRAHVSGVQALRQTGAGLLIRGVEDLAEHLDRPMLAEAQRNEVRTAPRVTQQNEVRLLLLIGVGPSRSRPDQHATPGRGEENRS